MQQLSLITLKSAAVAGGVGLRVSGATGTRGADAEAEAEQRCGVCAWRATLRKGGVGEEAQGGDVSTVTVVMHCSLHQVVAGGAGWGSSTPSAKVVCVLIF